MDPLEQFKATFLAESREYLDEIQQDLAGLDANDPDIESLHAIFRGVHSIKGGAGSFGFETLVGFAHIFETVLDGLRSGEIAVTDAVVDVMLVATDVLTNLVDLAEAGGDADPAEVDAVKAKLNAIMGAEPAAPQAAVEPPETDAGADDAGNDPPDDVDPVQKYLITFAPSSDMLQRANEPLLILRHLARLGEISVTVDDRSIPELDDIEPLGAYLRWTIELVSDVELGAVEEAFEFLSEDCELKIETSDVTGAPAAEAPAPEDEPDEFGFVPVRADAPGTDADPAADAPEADELGFVPVRADDTPVEAVPDQDAPAADASPAPPTASAPPPQAMTVAAQAEKKGSMSIRVDLDKIDRLVNMVGELVIAQAMLGQLAQDLSSKQFSDLTSGLESLGQTVRGIQESVMSIRAQPVKSVFSRMSRVVRDLCRDTGKDIKLITIGEETEVDKTVIEHLTDPLTHMIRNSADHGIEKPDDRIAAGKTRQGTIKLSARHRSGRVVIEVTDDGAGINRERVLSKAVEKGLVPEGAELTAEEIDNLIFAPGFSTAEAVSNLSGRGVGMDVVRRNIQELGGRVTIVSEPGKGSVITMTLPLTLAVMDGMVVRVGNEVFILPLTSIVETVHPNAEDICPLVNGSEVLRRRGEYIPLVHTRAAFNVPDAGTLGEGLIVIVENENDQKVGIGIDEMIGQQQVVLKSLEENYAAVTGVSSATIMGDGQVALILDIAGLCEMAPKVTGPVGPQPEPAAA